MLVYHLVYDIPDPAADPMKYRVLVAYKNVFGVRFKGGETDPSVLNGAGQLVIPGGDPKKRIGVIAGGQLEFFEETGIDFTDPRVREEMGCMRDAWYELLNGRDRAYCVYQRVEDVTAVWKACNKNIHAQDTRDQELYLTMLRNASDVCRYFGRIPDIALKSGWRRGQYKQLDSRKQQEAEEKSQFPGDWFVTAVELLLRSDN